MAESIKGLEFRYGVVAGDISITGEDGWSIWSNLNDNVSFSLPRSRLQFRVKPGLELTVTEKPFVPGYYRKKLDHQGELNFDRSIRWFDSEPSEMPYAFTGTWIPVDVIDKES